MLAKSSSTFSSHSSTSCPPNASASAPPVSSLVSRLAASSSSAASPFQADDCSLSHVIPLSLPARPLPLSIDDTAAEAKRLQRKHKKAERKKKAADEQPQAEAQPQGAEQQPLPPVEQSAATSQHRVEGAANGDGHEEHREGNGCSAADEGRAAAAPLADAGRKKKAKEHKVDLTLHSLFAAPHCSSLTTLSLSVSFSPLPLASVRCWTTTW